MNDRIPTCQVFFVFLFHNLRTRVLDSLQIFILRKFVIQWMCSNYCLTSKLIHNIFTVYLIGKAKRFKIVSQISYSGDLQ